MNILESLNVADRHLLAALPYRVGLWVSRIDNAGGAEADAHELIVLSNIIEGFAHDVFGSEQVQYVMRETLAQKARWPQWDQNLDFLGDECARAVEILGEHLEPKEVKAYAARLMDIAEAVAMAFSEVDDTKVFIAKLPAYAGYALAKIKAMMAGRTLRSMDQFLRVSPTERKALDLIASSLGLQGSY